MKTIFNAVVSIFYTREKFCRSRDLDEVTGDWRKLELICRVFQNSSEPLEEAPRGFGFGLASLQHAAERTRREAAPVTPFSSPDEAFFFETLECHFYKAA